MENKPEFKIALSRTDSIGDVVLTLPMAGVIKMNFPNAKVVFIGRTYTKDVVALSEHVDEFVNYDDVLKLKPKEQIQAIKNMGIAVFIHVFPVKHIAFLAKSAKIVMRIGTRSRAYHWLTCNKLIALPRKKSDLHESQLNLKLLSVLNINVALSLTEINTHYRFTKILPLGNELVLNSMDKTKTKIILHPKSKGSAREWGLDNFSKLVKALPSEKYQLFISGTKEDGIQLKEFIVNNPSATDLTGKLSLKEFISFISLCDVLIAASTGPLHIAAALNKRAIGLFAPMKPIHPGRWAPVGANAEFLVLDKECSDCRKGGKCSCIEAIEIQKVLNLIEKV